MKKKISKKSTANENKQQKTIKLLICVVVLLVAVLLAVLCKQVAHTLKQGDVDVLAGLITRAVENLKAPAPVDPKTGDTYFPQAKLYLPATGDNLQLTYSYDAAPSQEGGLSVSSKTVFTKNATSVESAQTVEKVFEHVPKLQACQRGVRVTYNLLSGKDFILKTSTVLTNGKTLYVYTEKTCPELSDTADLLKNLRAY